MKKHLSKSNYLIGLECPSYLWLKFNAPEKIPKPNNQILHIFEVGKYVGELAKKVFPKGINIPDEDFEENIKKTSELLKERKPLFEAAILIDNLYSRADILVPVNEDEWDIVEVKSAARIKDINIKDVSFQKYVYEKAGLKIRKCFLMHVNKQYIKKGAIEPKELFVQTEITENVENYIEGIEERIDEMFKVISLKKQPEITCEDIMNVVYGNHLIDEFYESLPEESVFELYRIQKKVAVSLYQEGIKCIKDIPEGTKLTEKQKIQQVCSIEQKKHADREKLQKFLDSLEYPLYFLDFETMNLAVPKFDGTRPFEQTPFQYSLHIIKKEGAEPEHISFLADGIDDPRPKFMQSLKDNLGISGSIIVYSQSFEKGRLKECALAFPEFEDFVENTNKRIVDLLIPFREFHYYDPKQKGSASIKKVLPVMSDLSYKDLEIDNGMDASIEYEKATFGDIDPSEKKKIRDALEKYCELDTLAEVLILRQLGEIVKEE